ncbi:MAG: HD domain-containing protein [Patescibacteria group bacterium]
MNRFAKLSRAFPFVSALSRAFPKSEVYLVGGAVRDILLGREVTDYDFVVRGVAARELARFLGKLGRVDLVGRVFGVLKFVPKKMKVELEPFDIALPRTETSTGDGGYRDFVVRSDPRLRIEDDLARRDFTINAMAFQLPSFPASQRSADRLVDPFGGLQDLRKKTIRAVGKPAERFREDYSRMLRGLRFAMQLGFGIEEKTWKALVSLMPRINDEHETPKGPERVVPYETIARELLKALVADPAKTIELWHDSRALKTLMPELLKMRGCPQPPNYHSEGDVWTHMIMALKVLRSPQFRREFGKELPDAMTTLAVLFHDIGKPYTIQTPEKNGTDRIRFNEHDKIGAEVTEKIARRLHLSAPGEFGVDTEKLSWLIAHHLLAVHGNVVAMKASTLEKYFFNPNVPGETLFKLMFADGSATIAENGKPMLTDYRALRARCGALSKGAKRYTLPKPFLNGDEVMKLLKLKPGPEVGEALRALREEQLASRVHTKAQAKIFLKKSHAQ